MTGTGASGRRPFVIDALQYCNWSRRIFEEMRAGGVDAVHATIAYHEDLRETIDRIVGWNRRFALHRDLIAPARSVADIEAARASGRTAILFGAQNPLPIGSDLGLVEVLHTLGLRFLQLSYNNQSLLCSGWQETEDSGLTRFGRQVIGEMNRLGLVIDMSHAGERSTLEAIAASHRPVAVTHANPQWFRDTRRNVSDRVIRALAESDGMLGLSLYPHHLENGSACTLERFAAMAARLAGTLGPGRIGIGSDLCQDQPDSVVAWMRIGRWKFDGPGNTDARATFPAQPGWFTSNRDFPRLRTGLRGAGFSETEVDGILGENWLRFMRSAFAPEQEEPRK